MLMGIQNVSWLQSPEIIFSAILSTLLRVFWLRLLLPQRCALHLTSTLRPWDNKCLVKISSCNSKRFQSFANLLFSWSLGGSSATKTQILNFKRFDLSNFDKNRHIALWLHLHDKMKKIDILDSDLTPSPRNLIFRGFFRCRQLLILNNDYQILFRNRTYRE